MLRLCGYRVGIARAPAKALPLADVEPPGAAMLDIGLPDLDG